MTPKWIKVIMLLICVAVFWGCDKDNDTDRVSPIENKTWVLVNFQSANGDVVYVPSQMASTLNFSHDTKKVTGYVMCNMFTSAYTIFGNRIDIVTVAPTEKGCGPDNEGQTQFVIDVLSTLDTFSINGTTLVLNAVNGDRLTFTSGPVSETPQILSIETGTSFGMCIGYCNKTMQVNAQKVILTQVGNRSTEYPKVTKELAFSAKRWIELSSTVDLDAFNALPQVIGCPDCADGGAESITIITTEGEKKVTFEFNSAIKDIEPFLTRLRALRTEMFTEFEDQTVQSLLDENRKLWDSKQFDSYSYTVRRSCFCPPEEDIIITVQSGNIVSAVYTPSGDAVGEARMESLFTIDEFYDYIQSALDQNAYKVDVTYDIRNGFPATIFIDRDFYMIDEEMSYTLFDFEEMDND